MAASVITSAAFSVISSTLNSLATIVWNEVIFLRDVPEKVKLIEAKLILIQGYLKDAENKPQRTHLTENWLREIKRVAYRAQDVIEKINCLRQGHNQRDSIHAFSRYSKISEHLKSLHETGEEINKINMFIPEMIEIKNNLNGLVLGEGSSMADQIEDSRDPRTTIHSSTEDEIVGFDSEIRNIVNELLDPTNEQLSVISILGMGGIGKSTLAKKVVNHSNVKAKFDVNIWITISQQYNVVNLQKEILKAITHIENKDLEKITVEEVKEKMLTILKEKKYLIVIDDIWTTKSWDDINPHNSTFPNMNNGSRIMLTSRNLEVAKYPAIKKFVHEVNPLDDEKSWKLLKQKAFPPYVTLSDIDINQLEYLGPQLAKKCKGLPLALIVLGGYLSKHLDYQTWSRMTKNIDWNEAGSQINISQILALSYHDLPNHLKPTFLYITAFPEDEMIKSSDLIKLWIAEGLIYPSHKYKPETMARIYLDQLYERGLVQVVRKSRTHGRISRIRIHDVLRDWGIERAKEEGFFYVIKDANHATFFDAYVPYRVALYGDCDEDVTTSMPHLRSFLGFELTEKNVYIRNLDHIRVIRYSRVRTCNKLPNKLPNYLKHMTLLRYLFLNDLKGNVYFPSSIGELSNLQILHCSAEIWSLPSSLWEISTLRHVHLEWVRCNWNGPKKGSAKNIQTLQIKECIFGLVRETVGWMYTGMDGVADALEEMKHIVHLTLNSFITSRRLNIIENVLSKISGCGHLEVLNLYENPIKGFTRIPDVSVFPPNILKLGLSCANLVKDPMPVLEKLPKLIVLELYFSWTGSGLQSFNCTRGGFPQLKYVRLEELCSLEEWKVEGGAMPNLHHLKIRDCKALKMFPEELMEHPWLQLLEIVGEVPHLSGIAYSRLQNKGCKVVITKHSRDTALSGV